MTALLTRRKVLAGMGVLGLGLLAGCDTRGQLSYKYGKDLSNKIMGRTFKLKNTDGETMTLSSFRGMMPMVFFGFTQCPAVCPTTLARAAKIKKLMGKDGDRLQVIFISLDPVTVGKGENVVGEAMLCKDMHSIHNFRGHREGCPMVSI